ncbi:MAG: hypothetical protein KF826_12270 [Xanthobacteraceae bacterium]|nr:hypothetical protein [Xanthobacteraceae bacterium]
MIDLQSALHIILEEAGYRAWRVSSPHGQTICFEDESLMGFAVIFDEPRSIVENWKSAETNLLTRFASNFRNARDKAWNVYSVFLSAKNGAEEDVRSIKEIEENLERTRKIAACGLVSREDIVAAIIPLLPIQYSPRLDQEDLGARLKRRIAAIAPAVTNIALDDAVQPADVVKLLGEA